jgi:hypothetical protein
MLIAFLLTIPFWPGIQTNINDGLLFWKQPLRQHYNGTSFRLNRGTSHESWHADSWHLNRNQETFKKYVRHHQNRNKSCIWVTIFLNYHDAQSDWFYLSQMHAKSNNLSIFTTKMAGRALFIDMKWPIWKVDDILTEKQSRGQRLAVRSFQERTRCRE